MSLAVDMMMENYHLEPTLRADLESLLVRTTNHEWRVIEEITIAAFNKGYEECEVIVQINQSRKEKPNGRENNHFGTYPVD
jgi:hypothetical protein